MDIYNYNNITKEFTGITKADADPEETRIKGGFVPLVPAYATLKEVPEYNKDNQIPVFENNEWIVKADYRKNYKKCDDNFNISDINEIGEITDGYLVSNDVAKLIQQNPDRFKIENNEVVEKTDEEYQKELEFREKERIALLNLTAADVERAIYKAKGMDFEDIIALVENNPNIDLKALKIELKANNFYRGNPYINQIGQLLGFTSKQLDEFFETGSYTKLLGVSENE